MMTPKDLDLLARELPFVKAWVEAVEGELFRALEAGEEFSNAKLVPKRPMRKWSVGVDVISLLSPFSPLDEIAPRKPLSPAEAEKVLGKPLFRDKLAKSVTSQSSGMKLVFCNEEELED